MYHPSFHLSSIPCLPPSLSEYRFWIRLWARRFGGKHREESDTHPDSRAGHSVPATSVLTWPLPRWSQLYSAFAYKCSPYPTLAPRELEGGKCGPKISDLNPVNVPLQWQKKKMGKKKDLEMGEMILNYPDGP